MSPEAYRAAAVSGTTRHSDGRVIFMRRPDDLLRELNGDKNYQGVTNFFAGTRALKR